MYRCFINKDTKWYGYLRLTIRLYMDGTISDAKHTMPQTSIKSKVKIGSAPDVGTGED
jgi:hypothetical protein